MSNDTKQYYMLECYGSPFEDAADLAESPDIPGIDSWMAGTRIKTDVPTPIRLSIDPENPGAMLEMFKSDILLMSSHLVEALRSVGVDNIQAYSTVIEDRTNNKSWENYLAVNIVGVLSCADLEKSKWNQAEPPGMIGMDFEGVTIDSERAGGLLMFRLAECISAIVVHEKVKAHLLEQGFTTLTFTPPEEWVG